MIIPLLDVAVTKFGVMYNHINTMIGLWNQNDTTNLQTISKVSLLSAINEVNSKKVPFYLKDSSTKTNITLEV